jgi:hypothetical protein
MKYISMKIEPNGSKPDAGIMNSGAEYHGATGIGLNSTDVNESQ